MQTTKKVGLSFLMGLGFLAAAFAVVRTWYFPKLLQLDVTCKYLQQDQTGNLLT